MEKLAHGAVAVAMVQHVLSLDVYDVQGLFSKAQTTAVRLMEQLAHRAVVVVVAVMVAQAYELSFGPVSDKGL
jgi:hypothetical protein